MRARLYLAGVVCCWCRLPRRPLVPERPEFEVEFAAGSLSLVALAFASYLFVLGGRHGRKLRANAGLLAMLVVALLAGLAMLLYGVFMTAFGVRDLLHYFLRPGLRNEWSGLFLLMLPTGLLFACAGVAVLIAAGGIGAEGRSSAALAPVSRDSAQEEGATEAPPEAKPKLSCSAVAAFGLGLVYPVSFLADQNLVVPRPPLGNGRFRAAGLGRCGRGAGYVDRGGRPSAGPHCHRLGLPEPRQAQRHGVCGRGYRPGWLSSHAGLLGGFLALGSGPLSAPSMPLLLATR